MSGVWLDVDPKWTPKSHVSKMELITWFGVQSRFNITMKSWFGPKP